MSFRLRSSDQPPRKNCHFVKKSIYIYDQPLFQISKKFDVFYSSKFFSTHVRCQGICDSDGVISVTFEILRQVLHSAQLAAGV